MAAENILDNDFRQFRMEYDQRIFQKYVAKETVGKGLEIDDDNKLNVKVGEGLDVNGSNQLICTVKGAEAGRGLCEDEGKLHVTAGEGLAINGSNQLICTVKGAEAGYGLYEEDGELNVRTDGGTLYVDDDNYLKVRAGKGLDNDGYQINVTAGEGLAINGSNQLICTVKGAEAGRGLYESDGKLNVNLGGGLDFDKDDYLKVRAGKGLDFDGDTLICTVKSAEAGRGLYESDGKLNVNLGGGAEEAGLYINDNGELYMQYADEWQFGTVKVSRSSSSSNGIYAEFIGSACLKLCRASENQFGGIYVGTGLKTDWNGVLSVDTGEGLNFDGNQLSVSSELLSKIESLEARIAELESRLN